MKVKETAIERAKGRYDSLVQRRGEQVVAMRQAGLTFAEIAGHFGVTRARVHQIYRQATLSARLEPAQGTGEEAAQ